MSELAEPFCIGAVTAPNRIVFGPHETNLGRRRSFSDRHVAYYRARAAGGAGVVVTETASVHPTDWPYERAPLASSSADGWSEISAACHLEGALVIASLGHAGGQGSSAYHQQVLWGPSRTPDVTTREVPKAMEQADIDELVAGFASSARQAVESGCDGVEIDAGQWSLLRQFASGLTNQRDDEYGNDRGRLIAEVLTAVRASVPGAVLGLRLSCDELAPWAGITAETAVELALGLARPATTVRAGEAPPPPRMDYLTVVRGSAYGPAATRPDGQVEPGFNRAVTAEVRRALPEEVVVVAQGSIVDPGMARDILAAGEADAVEMTRAQITDPALARKLVARLDDSVRPCILCNQMCQVRDSRNPIVSCVGEPRSGHEWEDPDPGAVTDTASSRSPDRARSHVLVVGGGPAGLECARVSALSGMRVTLLERRAVLGGMVTSAAGAPGRSRLARLTEWLEAECQRLGVEVVTGEAATLERCDSHDGPIVLCTGSRPGRRTYDVVAPGTVLAAADVLATHRLPGDRGPASSVVWDPVGGPIGIGAAELLSSFGGQVTFVTPDFVAGEQLSRSGDLATANVRLARAGVEILKHSVVRGVDGGVMVEDRFSGERRLIPHALLVDAGHRLPDDTLHRSLMSEAGRPHPVLVAGDAVAPRTVHEAVLEGRRVALGLAERPVAPANAAGDVT